MKATKRSGNGSPLVVMRAQVAGVDVGSQQHWVAGPPSEDGKRNVRAFMTTTGALHEIADWLASQGVQSVAMESTSVYWIPLYEHLESRGFEVLLVNARQLHNVPGRKTDMLDCQWLQVLHSCGLLRGSFRPPEAIARIRALHRAMSNLIHERTRAIQWMQKALDQMNIQVHRAVSDLSGTTGLAIVRAIVAGERDARKLAALRDARCSKTEAEISKYLEGTWRDEHIFNLASGLRLFDFVEREITTYNQRLDAELELLEQSDRRGQAPPSHPNKSKENRMRREGKADRRDRLFRVAGVDLTCIDGINIEAATMIINEVGTDLSPFPTEHHFVSWLRLCPRPAISGGKVLPKAKKKGAGAHRIAAALRMAATTLGRSKTALGGYYRRISRRKDAGTAVFATARKLACIVYRLLRFGQPYVDLGAEAYEAAFAQRRLRALRTNALELGYELIPSSPQPSPTG